MWYNGGMNYGDWITLAAVVVALGLGVSSLIQTQRLQQRERKERLLNEIIEWAIEIANIAFGWEIRGSLPKGDNIERTLVRLSNEISRYQVVDTKSVYIAKCSEIFGEELHAAVLAVTSSRNNVGLNIEKLLKNIMDADCQKCLNETQHELRRLSLIVLALVAKIKTK